MSSLKADPLPKPIQQALNQIAHSRALLYQAACRAQIRKEIDALLSSGLNHEEAIDALRASPPTLDPDY